MGDDNSTGEAISLFDISPWPDVVDEGDPGLDMRAAYGFNVDGDDERKGCCA